MLVSHYRRAIQNHSEFFRCVINGQSCYRLGVQSLLRTHHAISCREVVCQGGRPCRRYLNATPAYHYRYIFQSASKPILKRGFCKFSPGLVLRVISLLDKT